MTVQDIEPIGNDGTADSTAPVASIEFARAIGHAIQTPMYSLLGFAELLAESELDHEQARMVEGLLQASDSLRTLLQGVLDYCRVAAGGFVVDRARFDVRTLVREILAEYAPAAKRKGLELRLLLADDVPEAVVADRAAIALVMRILVDNAIEFTDAGRIKVAVGVDESIDVGTALRLAVTDTGPGVGSDVLALLFEPALRAPRPDGSAHLGLSLALARHLAREMQGEIDVKTHPGTGSTFSLTVRADEADAETATEAEAAPPSEPPSTMVLVVEDNEVNRELALRQLRRIGYETVVATNGREAVQLVDERRFGAVLMDCRMPEMDGFEATRRIRAGERGESHVPVIAMTANAMNGDREACLEAGMDDYMAKPVDLATMRAVMFRWLPLEVSGPSAAVDDREVLSGATIDELLAGLDGDRAALGAVVDSYLAELQVRRLRIVAASRSGDRDELDRACHALASASTSLGAARLAETCHAIAATTEDADAAGLPALLNQLKNECELAAAALRRLTQAGAPDAR